jgi:hypothetical protein
LQCSACKSDEEDGKDHDKESKDDEVSEQNVPVHALCQKQAFHKTFTQQGSPDGQWQQPF